VGAEAASVCTDCLARHHDSCWTDHGRCSACESTRRLRPDEAEQEPQIGGSTRLTRDPVTILLVAVGLAANWFLLQQGTPLQRMEGPALTLILGAIIGWRSRSPTSTLLATTAMTSVGTLAWWLDHSHASLILNTLAAVAGGLLLGLPGSALARVMGPRSNAEPAESGPRSEAPQAINEGEPGRRRPKQEKA